MIDLRSCHCRSINFIKLSLSDLSVHLAHYITEWLEQQTLAWLKKTDERLNFEFDLWYPVALCIQLIVDVIIAQIRCVLVHNVVRLLIWLVNKDVRVKWAHKTKTLSEVRLLCFLLIHQLFHFFLFWWKV